MHALDHAPPPDALNGLRARCTDLQRDASQRVLGARALEVLARLLDSPRETAMYSITQLAASAGVHASTLTRLAKNLGYHGFGAFQDVFREHVASTGRFYSGQADRLLHDATDGDAARLIARVGRDESANIARMLEDLDPVLLEAAATLIAQAPRVRSHGLRQSFSIACYVSYVLGLLRNDVAVLGAPEHGIAHGLAQLEPGDVLLLVGCAPYTRGTVQAARLAADHGLTVVALTDSHASPLGVAATHTFLAPTTGVFVANGMAAFLVLAEALVALVAQALGEAAIGALRKREALMREQNVGL